MEWFTNPEIWISLITLTLLEIVLGIDNIIFISIMASKLPANKQKKARQLGLALAMITRVLLLLSLSWIMTLTSPLFNIGEWIALTDSELLKQFAISGRDLILIIGGLFLIYKSTSEIHDKLEGADHQAETRAVITFTGVIVQILLLDIVFSLDSVITAVGMADHIEVMIAAVIIAVLVMMLSAGGISEYAKRGRAYVVYANGKSTRTKYFGFFRVNPRIKPGSEIILPETFEKKDKAITSIVQFVSILAQIGGALATLSILNKQ